MTELKLKVGKLYRTRDGRKAFCFREITDTQIYQMRVAVVGKWYTSYTKEGIASLGGESSLDIVAEWEDEPTTKTQSDQMTLRDQFAMNAPSLPNNWPISGIYPTVDELSIWSYAYADAMLAERIKGDN